MNDELIYGLLISLIPTDQLLLLSAKIQSLNNEINNELKQRNNTPSQPINIYVTNDREFRVNSINIHRYDNEILYEFKRYGNCIVDVVDQNNLSIIYNDVNDAKIAKINLENLRYAIAKIVIE